MSVKCPINNYAKSYENVYGIIDRSGCAKVWLMAFGEEKKIFVLRISSFFVTLHLIININRVLLSKYKRQLNERIRNIRS